MNHEIKKPNNIPEQPKKELEIDYEPFDPKAELKNLRACNKEARAEKLENYKTELIRQKEGIVEIQNDLEQQIRKNPDLSQEELMKIAFAKAPEYRLSENQLGLFKDVLNKYIEKHQAVREARKKYPDDKELFKACFGKKPEEVVEIIEGPVTLYFRCHDLKDYAWIYHLKFFDPEEKQKLSKPDIRLADETGGCMIPKCLLPTLDNTITVERTKEKPSTEAYIESTFKHEEQHSINKLFNEQMIYSEIKQIAEKIFTHPNIQQKINEELQNQNSSKLLTLYLKSIEEEFINKAKNEILAFCKEGISIRDACEHLTRARAVGGLYDYYENQKDTIKNTLREKLGSLVFDKNKKTIEKMMHKILNYKYRKEIGSAIYAVYSLENMGKSREEIVHLLIAEPLNQWEKLVKRIKKVKK